MLVSGDSPVAITVNWLAVGFADSFSKLQPELLILLGDRFEALAAAQAAMFANIPIAHLHGGEITQGVIDEAIRHNMTKMSCAFCRSRAISPAHYPAGEQPGECSMWAHWALNHKWPPF